MDNENSGEDKSLVLGKTKVLAVDANISWDTPTETVRFWIPFTNSLANGGHTSYGGFDYNSSLCNSST